MPEAGPRRPASFNFARIISPESGGLATEIVTGPGKGALKDSATGREIVPYSGYIRGWKTSRQEVSSGTTCSMARTR